MTSDTYTFETSLWNFAPERWVSPEGPDEFTVTDAAIVGDSGNEGLVVEVERTAADSDEEVWGE